MLFENVRIAALGSALPAERVRSDELEARLAPLYGRLGLHAGRLELMSGIRERRFWPPGTRPSEIASRAGAEALERAGIPRGSIGCLVHASVCRDFLEPATASVVHHRLELSPECEAFDLSNACLGFVNAMLVLASRIERGELEAGLVVAGEDGRPLVERTLRALADASAGRAELTAAYASLTIGSGGAAAVLTSARLAPAAPRLAGGVSRAATEHHGLCSGDVAPGDTGPRMETDSEALLQAGNALALETWRRFTAELGWTHESIDRVVTHQVGAAHRRLLFETLGLDVDKDFPTVGFLGNVGSVSLPVSLALAIEAGFIDPASHRVALLGIGSGIQCAMLGLAPPSPPTTT